MTQVVRVFNASAVVTVTKLFKSLVRLVSIVTLQGQLLRMEFTSHAQSELSHLELAQKTKLAVLHAQEDRLAHSRLQLLQHTVALLATSVGRVQLAHSHQE